AAVFLGDGEGAVSFQIAKVLGGGGGVDISARAYNAGNQSIPNAVWTTLNLNAEDYDTDTIHDLVTNPTRMTSKTAGKYVVLASVRFNSNTTGYRAIQLLKNGVIAGVDERPVSAASGTVGLSLGAILSCRIPRRRRRSR
ncbi:MAG: hypothetical protein FD130_2496, partial [Halothiobacillaceae bacterium]